MDEKKEMPARGRGAFIAAALRKAQAAKLAPVGSQPGGSGDIEEPEPPRPRGRAALLQTLKKMEALKVGSAGDAKPTTSTIEPPKKPDTSEPKTISMEVHAPAEQKVAAEPPEEELPVKNFIGESGKHVPASANYIRLILAPEKGVYEYEVRFDPIVDSMNARYRMLSTIIVQYADSKTFDGHTLYLPVRCFDRQDFTVEHPFDNTPVVMTIIYKQQKRMDECIHLYNVLFKRIMNILQFKRVGRQFFDNQNPIPIPQHKLEIWPGYVTAVNEYAGGIMLCLDVQHRVLRTQNALNFMYDMRQTQGGRAKELISKGLIGSSVLTRYNNASYIVHDITWDVNPTCSFNTAKGPVKYVDYFKNQYNAKIEDLTQPMLIHRSTVRVSGSEEKEDRLILLVPELSYMTGLTDAMRADMRIMKDIAQHTRVTPNHRMNSLRKFINSVEQNPEAKAVLSSWGLKIGSATIDLQMRILDPETILFGNDVTFYGTEQADWTSAAMKNHVISAIDFRNWLIIYTRQDDRLVKDFVEMIMRLGPRMGINVSSPELWCMKDDRTESYLNILNERINPQLQILVVVAPTNRDDRYMMIKKTCCHKKPIPSQVINSRTLKNRNKLSAITQKIALQMNCKIGGTLWSVRFPFKTWMICGIDVYHSKSSGGKAVCGFVSSLNESITRWYSTVCFHSTDRELGDHLKPLLIKSLQEFKHANLTFPSHIVIYRDGVGDGQFKTCQELEIRQFVDALRVLNLDCKLIFIVVQKRINTRLFMSHRDVQNPPPGSIVDKCVTKKHFYDFFLISQHVRQGTVTPTHYTVLHNDANLKADYIQRLSYKLCHMYYNWTGTVRVPAPCQYAHKLAYLVGQFVRAEPSTKLASRLYYL